MEIKYLTPLIPVYSLLDINKIFKKNLLITLYFNLAKIYRILHKNLNLFFSPGNKAHLTAKASSNFFCPDPI